MIRYIAKINPRERRHRRVRVKVVGTGTRPRLAVFRSLRATYAQLINDQLGFTLVSASDRELTKSAVEAGKSVKKNKTERAGLVGKLLAERAVKLGIKQITFDRGGYLYAGRVKALAEGARQAGLIF